MENKIVFISMTMCGKYDEQIHYELEAVYA